MNLSELQGKRGTLIEALFPRAMAGDLEACAEVRRLMRDYALGLQRGESRSTLGTLLNKHKITIPHPNESSEREEQK